MSKSLKLQRFTVLASAVLLLTGLISCTGKGPFAGKLFKERASETPAPSDQTIDKSFFVDPTGKPKTFLCAYAPEMAAGGWAMSNWELFVNNSPHCNLEFEIKENVLIGKMINPSFLNARDRWQEFVRIPITKHYYYEREKDQHGRETNRFIKNDQRSHWTARPKIELSLDKVTFVGLSAGFGRQDSSAYDIEWDAKNSFLGFTVDLRLTHAFLYSLGYEAAQQVKMRFNFLKFEHDPTFKKVPYHQENSRHMNILHVMGRRIEGMEPELYAAHWDLRKTNTIYLNGVPQQHQKTVLDAIEKWNQTLRKTGAVANDHVAFKGEVKNMKHPFDLRYPSFNWISDPQISAHSPLGIGMAHADLRNGKILWGSVAIYGGMLERYVNAYTPLESALNSGARILEPMSPVRSMGELIPKSFPMANGLDQFNETLRASMVNDMVQNHKSYLPQLLQEATKPGSRASESEVAGLRAALEKFNNPDPGLNKVVRDAILAARGQAQEVRKEFSNSTLGDYLGTSVLKEASKKTHATQAELTAAMQNARPGMDLAKIRAEGNLTRRQQMLEQMQHGSGSAVIVEEGLTAARLVGGWMNSEARRSRTYPEMLESVVMDLTLHELGHMFGLGHQFKENIVPEEGTVPSEYIVKAKELATTEKGFTNSTSVMGYRNGRTAMIIPAKDLAPGAQDELVLRYLYKGQYATFDKEADKFVFGQVPVNGKIPRMSEIVVGNGQKKYLPAAYFPNCNDYEASLGADPFCNRWDRGSKAEDIVSGYFEHIGDNLLSNLFSMVGGSGYSESQEGHLWYSALDTFGRVRMFYDEMRRRLRSEPGLAPLWNRLRTDKAAMLEFSKACSKEDPTGNDVQSETLREIFKNKDIVDLCRANLKALNEFKFFLNLPDSDYTRIDHNNRYMNGGYLAGDTVRNYGHMFGSWYQMTNLPLKISSLYTVLSANPHLLWWGQFLGPNLYYENEANRFLYRTLYPREYTNLISEAVEHNMRFAATGMDDTTRIGRTVMASGWLMPFGQWNSNDAARLPREYNDLLNQQTQFTYSIVAILISPVTPDTRANVKAEHVKKFTATVFDFMTGKPASVREIFVLPKGEVLAWANGMFIYPITKMKFYSGKESYVIAYKVAYDYEEGDELVEDSVKAAMLEKHDAIAKLCVDGFNGYGVKAFFEQNNPEFEGFLIPPGIAEESGKEKLGLFYKTVDDAWKAYEKKVVSKNTIPASFPLKTMTRVCDETMRGIGQISASAALINGFWLGITHEYLEK